MAGRKGESTGDARFDEALDQDWADLGDPSVLSRLGSSLDENDKPDESDGPAEDPSTSPRTIRVDGTPPPAPGGLPGRLPRR